MSSLALRLPLSREEVKRVVNAINRSHFNTSKTAAVTRQGLKAFLVDI